MDLSDAYAVSAYIEGADAFPEMWESKAQAFRDGLGGRARLDLNYGIRARERFDLFLPEGDPVGLAVFVHGGYWMAFDKDSWSHLAAGPLARGWAVAMPSYTLTPEARIGEITAQVARAISVAAELVAGPIVVTGHSAGGHLAARMVDKAVLAADVAARLEQVIAISPLSDLRPLMQTLMNETLGIDAQEAAAQSPVLTVERLDVPVTVWVGADEQPSFLDQGRWLAEAWGCDLEVPEGYHHFDVIDPLADANSALTLRLTEGRTA